MCVRRRWQIIILDMLNIITLPKSTFSSNLPLRTFFSFSCTIWLLTHMRFFRDNNDLHFCEVSLKLFQNFFKFFYNFIKLPTIFRRFFFNGQRIIPMFPCSFSKLSCRRPPSPHQSGSKTFKKFDRSVSKIFSEFLKDFFKLAGQFFGNVVKIFSKFL